MLATVAGRGRSDTQIYYPPARSLALSFHRRHEQLAKLQQRQQHFNVVSSDIRATSLKMEIVQSGGRRPFHFIPREENKCHHCPFIFSSHFFRGAVSVSLYPNLFLLSLVAAAVPFTAAHFRRSFAVRAWSETTTTNLCHTRAVQYSYSHLGCIFTLLCNIFRYVLHDMINSKSIRIFRIHTILE